MTILNLLNVHSEDNKNISFFLNQPRRYKWTSFLMKILVYNISKLNTKFNYMNIKLKGSIQYFRFKAVYLDSQEMGITTNKSWF